MQSVSTLFDRNVELFCAMRQFVSDSFLLMKSRLSAGLTIPHMKQFAWAPINDGHMFELLANDTAMYMHSIHACWDDISEMESCTIAMQEIARDRFLSCHIGNLVGCTFAARTLREDTIFMELLDRCLNDAGNFKIL